MGLGTGHWAWGRGPSSADTVCIRRRCCTPHPPPTMCYRDPQAWGMETTQCCGLWMFCSKLLLLEVSFLLPSLLRWGWVHGGAQGIDTQC